jgi:hypothetical protein
MKSKFIFDLSTRAFLFGAVFSTLGDTVVVPNGNATVEGNDQLAPPFSDAGIRWQQVYTMGQFNGLFSDDILIKDLAFRIDGPVGTSFSTTATGISIQMSTTPVTFSTASTEFSRNVGSDVVTVLPSQNLPLSGTKTTGSSFDVVIPLPQSFRYNRNAGNLLVDIRLTGSSHASFFDGQSDSQNIVSFTIAGDVNGLVGNKAFQALVTEFHFEPVPEPAPLLLVGLTGFVAAGAFLVTTERRNVKPIAESAMMEGSGTTTVEKATSSISPSPT